MKAKISEIFYSIQGEGLYVGRPMVFVRFWGCNISCKFCDTHFKDFKMLSVENVTKRIDRYKKFTRYISLTGGEPLLWIDFLQVFLPILKRKRFIIYLETNGLLFENIEKVLRYLDIISMDIKLPSSTQLRPFWKEHSEFAKKVCSEKLSIFFKTVICKDTVFSDIKKLCSFVKKFRTPLVLQPDSLNISDYLVKKTLSFLNFLKENRIDAYFIPQIHKFLNMK
ncbi:MAG: hypothetical protein B6D55_08255 [Candidatus Omnitrophica bacterium 4484_70.2]|nr:MAG: hypothetical protein B6D55_08255 [Candidatus Omnitrophica bacterium 4484_70.2]